MAFTIVGLYLFLSQIHEYPFLQWEPQRPGGDARIVLPFVMIVSSLMLSKIPFSKSPNASMKGSRKDKFGFILGLTMIILTFASQGFLLFPMAIALILVSLLNWTRSQRDQEQAGEIE